MARVPDAKGADSGTDRSDGTDGTTGGENTAAEPDEGNCRCDRRRVGLPGGEVDCWESVGDRDSEVDCRADGSADVGGRFEPRNENGDEIVDGNDDGKFDESSDTEAWTAEDGGEGE